MIQYTVYNQAIGNIVKNGSCEQQYLHLQASDGEVAVEGYYEDTKYYWNNGFIPFPPKTSEYDVWNYQTEQWEQDYDLAVNDVTGKRNYLLYTSDWTDLVGAEQRLGTDLWTQWQVYRQELRDIPQQSGYPFNVVFPIPPQ